MARPKGAGLENDVPFTLRMASWKKRKFKAMSKEAGMSMNSYGLAKIFDEPLVAEGGKKPRSRPKTKAG